MDHSWLLTLNVFPSKHRLILRNSHRSGRLRGKLAFQRRDGTLKNPVAVVAAEREFAGALRMRHETGHVATLVADACDILNGTIRVGVLGQFAAPIRVLPQNLVVGLET